MHHAPPGCSIPDPLCAARRPTWPIKAGGRPCLLLDSPRLTRTLYAEAPEAALHKVPTAYDIFAAQHVDVAFYLPNGEDYATVRRVDRRAQVDAALAKANAATLAQRNRGITRSLYIGVPNASDTASIQMDYAPYEAMTWKAIEADYGSIAAKGKEIKRILRNAKRLHITSPEGTDFTVQLGQRPLFVDAGLVPPGTVGNEAARFAALPGGNVQFAPLEVTANGKIRAAEDQCDELVKDESLDSTPRSTSITCRATVPSWRMLPVWCPSTLAATGAWAG